MRFRDRLIVACFLIMVLLGEWRFGGTKLIGAGGGSPFFGPTNGRDWVVANAAPLQPSQPAGAILVSPGQLTQTLLSTSGTGATFWLLAGTHSVSSQLGPLQNQKIYCAAGAIIDGGGGALNHLIASSATGIEIHGGTWQNQGNASSAEFAATILAGGGLAGGGWLVEDATVKNNYNTALKFQAPNCVARRVWMNNNGRYGPNCAENTSGQIYAGIMFEHCRWNGNNSRLLNAGDAAGGSKFAHCSGLIVRYCFVHDNFGAGIWPDIPNIAGGTEVRENVVETNRRAGIFLEGPTGGCVVHRNYVLNNGWDPNSIGGDIPASPNPGIKITHSDQSLGSGIRGVCSRNDIDFNLTITNHEGWAIFVWNHNPPHPGRMKNWDIFENRIWLRTTTTGRVGGRDEAPDGTQLWDGDVDWFDNEYHVVSTTAAMWMWDSGAGTGATKTYTQWQAFHPGETIPLITI